MIETKKVNVLPCSGIGKALGTLARWSAYEIAENTLPESTRLLCLARLVVADKESKEIISNNLNITMDGCPKACAKKNVERNGGQVQQSYQIAKFLMKNRDLKLNSQNVIDPGPEALKLAKRIAEDIAVDIKELLNNNTEEN